MSFDTSLPGRRLADRTIANAQAAGVAAQVRFELLDASRAIPGQYDLITTFDVVHDAVDPRGLLRTIRQALRSSGTYLCLDVNCSDKPEEILDRSLRSFMDSAWCTA